ncbi:MAG: magnesium/cobalt transporter CorA [Chloroflexota bacterium]|nr:magnesium/cobalt transporter CorA [Chloroflexota bacterium]
MALAAYHLGADGTLTRDLSEDGVRAAFESGQGLLWIDICETTDEDARLLEQAFSFHHLAIEDCVSDRVHPPKIDDFGDYLFIIVHGINHTTESDIVQTAELALFLGPHYVVSTHKTHLYSVESVRRMVEDRGRPMRRGATFLAHSLIDALIDNVLPTIDKMSEFAEDIEEEVIRAPQLSSLESVIKLKRSALRIHRVMAPQRETINQLSRGEFAMVGEDALIFFRDIYDHVVRIEELNQSIRDRADYIMSTYLSSVANRQNETMRVLSIVATIFMPLTLVAAIYGMNFDNMPELHVSWAYFAVLGFMAVIALGAIYMFWAKSWVSWGRRQVSRIKPFAVEPEKLIGHLGGLPRWHRR